MPSAILIRGDEPTESEIQAAAYLSKIRGKDIPLVKINKSKYQINSSEEMRKKDEELQKTFYKEMYERKRKKTVNIDIQNLSRIKETIIEYVKEFDMDENSNKKAM